MTQRQKSASHGVHLDTLICEKYMSKLVNREKQLNQLLTGSAIRSREKSKSVDYKNPIKPRPSVRQQPVRCAHALSPKQQPNTVQYVDDSPLVEVTVKTTNAPRSRSKSSTNNDVNETWSQLLQQYKSGDKNLFGNFDPLRTLHFLAKELQFQLQSILPDDRKVQQMISDMRFALKRVPPEVASQVQLFQGDKLQAPESAISQKEEVDTLDRGIQTICGQYSDNNEKLHRLMAEGTLKLEASCRQMEKLCGELKTEKQDLEQQLTQIREQNSQLKNTVFDLEKKIDDLDMEKNRILNPRISALEEEKNTLQSQIQTLYQTNSHSEFLINDLRSQVTELRSQKSSLEQDCNRLKHQVKVGSLEREKFVAVLNLRDTQINEIRAEMTQLQEMVNEQLLELHTSAFQGIPCGENVDEIPVGDCKPDKKEYAEKQMKFDKGGDYSTLSSISTNVDGYETPNNDFSFKNLQAGDIDLSTLPDIENIINGYPKNDPKLHSNQLQAQIEKLDSQTSIKNMFDELKKTAFAVVGGQRDNKYN